MMYLEVLWTQTAMELCNSNYVAKHQSSAVSTVFGMTTISAPSITDFKATSAFLYTYCKMCISLKKTLEEHF